MGSRLDEFVTNGFLAALANRKEHVADQQYRGSAFVRMADFVDTGFGDYFTRREWTVGLIDRVGFPVLKSQDTNSFQKS